MAEETKPTGEEQETGATSEELGDAGKRALDAERKARRAAEKRLGELEAKVKTAEDAEKTELEKLQSQVADLTRQAEAAVAKADRFEIAAAKGLTPAQARRLVGSTRDELEQDADEMRAELGIKEDGKGKEQENGSTESADVPQDEKPLGPPKEDLRPGASNTGSEEPDSGKLASQLLNEPF